MRGPLALALFACLPLCATTVILTSGTSWTAPAGITHIKVECIGAGGAGSQINGPGTPSRGGGGGGGAYAVRASMAVTPLASYTYSIGQGGDSASATNGTATQFTGDAQTCIAAGGASVPNNTATAGAGGAAGSSTGDTTFSGGNGADGTVCGCGGGGGGSAGSAAPGDAGFGPNGGTAVTGGGPGGAGRSGATNGTGSAPISGPGGGGGGANIQGGGGGTFVGGAGFNGQITITYSTSQWTGGPVFVVHP